MKPYVSEFERGRKIVLVLLVLAIAFGVVALCSAENSSQQVIFIFAAFTCMAGLIVASLKLCRCPHCGKRILNGVLVKIICPNCRRSLTTGKRVKR